jgi:hypothetical protein
MKGSEVVQEISIVGGIAIGRFLAFGNAHNVEISWGDNFHILSLTLGCNHFFIFLENL